MSTNIAAANESDNFYQFNNNFRVAFALSHLNYAEFEHGFSGEPLDQNKGDLYGLALSLRQQFHQLYLEIGLSALQGNTPYKGSSFSNIPLAISYSPSFITDSNIKLGYGFNWRQKFEFLPYGQLGYHTWQRATGSITIPNFGAAKPFQENYRNGYYAGGLRLTWQIVPKGFLYAYGSYGRTFDPEVFGAEVVDVLFLKPRPWYELGTGIEYLFLKHWHFFGSIAYNRFSYGQSNGSIFTNSGEGAFEPNSVTRFVNGYLGIAYDFPNSHNSSKEAKSYPKNTLQQINNQAGISFLAPYQSFTIGTNNSYENSPIPGEYSGFIPGFTLQASKSFFNHWILRLGGEYAEGSVAFNNNDLTIQTHNAFSSHYQAGFCLGYQKALWHKKTVALEPFVTVGYQRDLYSLRYNIFNNQSSYYYFGYAGGGIKSLFFNYYQTLAIMPSLSGGFTFANESSSAFQASAFFHPKFGAPWFEASLKFDYLMTKHLHFTTGAAYRFVKFNSATNTLSDPPATAFQPNAWYRTPSIQIGLSYDFP